MSDNEITAACRQFRDRHESRAISQLNLIHSLTYLFQMHAAIDQLTTRVRQICIIIKLIGGFERIREIVWLEYLIFVCINIINYKYFMFDYTIKTN